MQLCTLTFKLYTMKKNIFYISLFFYFILSNSLLSQTLEDKLIVWMENNNREQLINRIDKIKLAYPNSPIPIYIEAFIKKDANQAKVLYAKIVRQFTDSPYAEQSLMKLAQYRFMVESYVSARQLLEKLIDKFPKSKLIPEAKYLAAICLIATNNSKKAEKELKKLIKKYPKTKFNSLSQNELNILSDRTKQDKNVQRMIEPQQQTSQQSHLFQESKVYTVQIGAFGSKSNAEKQKEFYIREGIPTKIQTKTIGGKLLHLVWVEDFETIAQARNFGKMLKDRYGTSFRVVRK